MFSKIKNNPKKTVFFIGVLGYGVHYFNKKYRDNALRRQFCDEAKKLGDQFIHPLNELMRVTVIHNPVANNRKSESLFKDNIYPLLNLSGYKVNVIETDKTEAAKQLMSVIKTSDQDCLYIAGGDGTLMGIVSGLLQRPDLRGDMRKIPIVISPLGSNNSFFQKWYPLTSDNSIETCNESVKLIAKNHIKPCNAIFIRPLTDTKTENNSDNVESKDMYALSGLEWSIDRDVLKNGKRKWLFGPYRYHVQYYYWGLRGKHSSSNKTFSIFFQEPCQGCSNCVNNISDENIRNSSKSFLSSLGKVLLPMFFKDVIKKEKERELEISTKSKILNQNCGIVHERKLDNIKSLAVILDGDRLIVKIKNKNTNFSDYVNSGIKSLTDIPYEINNECDESFECKELKIIPEGTNTEKYYIDNEEVDIVPVELKVLKDALYFYS